MAKLELAGNADAVEFCPCAPYLHILAAASYTLQEGPDEQQRLGGLYLFSADQENDHSSSTPSLTKLYHGETPGVFDIKWRPYDDDGAPCLAQAGADGSLSLHMLEEGSALELHEKADADVSSSMCLYVDWNPARSNPEVVLSNSDGSISVVNLGQSQPEISASWQAHDFEAWVVAYDAWQAHVVYSGGDDCHLCCWDMREAPGRPAFRDKKTHGMGVCSIQSNALWENVLATGSYDEKVRLFDTRMTHKPLCTAELGLGGGVWRLKWHHARRDILLAACMHNGAAIAEVGEGGFRVLEQYKEHTSLTYGASWYRGDDAVDVTAERDKGLEGEGDERLCSSEVANSAGDEAGKVAQHGGAEGRLAGDGIGEGDDVGEERVSDEFRRLGVENSVRMKSLVATCSFYDRAVHLWRPKTFACGAGVT